jgi:hypothetical protein
VITRVGVLSLAVALVACGGEGFSPTTDTVAGSYTASTFTLTTSTGTTNLLALGGTATITLAAEGTTTGRLFVPGGSEDGNDLDEDLTGTWTLTGSTVTFSQTADTFIPDVEFTAGRNRLDGAGTFGTVTIRLVLSETG